MLQISQQISCDRRATLNERGKTSEVLLSTDCDKPKPLVSIPCGKISKVWRSSEHIYLMAPGKACKNDGRNLSCSVDRLLPDRVRFI
ncbi:unnamed protein product [Allacma fusca]|uniref:Uncharacterized protein n=1 Tax=Allacma fusca TaxID=39272 RepID=A0A8J2J817_9HEXA|nr:unnamed protein product [Allacma fusca]